MREKISKFCIYFLCIIICLISFTGCSLSQNEDEKTIQDKTNEEIDFLQDEILTIINKYAKGEYYTSQGEENEEESDQSILNWEEVGKNVTIFNETLDTIILDLSEVEISNDDLINFRNHINNISVAVSNEDRETLLAEVGTLYLYLPTLLEKYSNDNNKINIIKLKSLVASSYIYSELLDWENAKNSATLAENKYKEMMDDVNYMREYSYNLNKIYVLLEEFKSAIDTEQIDLTKVKYINFIEKF